MPRAKLNFIQGEGPTLSGSGNSTLPENMYPKIYPTGSKSEVVMTPRPTTAALSITGYTAANFDEVQAVLAHQGRLYFLAWDGASSTLHFYQTNSTGNTAVLKDSGNIAGATIATGTVSVPKMVAANSEILILDKDGDCWLYDIAGDSLAGVTDADFPSSVSDIAYQDGYFIVTETDTQKFYISAINDGSSWDALDFASATAEPDNLVGVISNHNELWLFGTRSVEVWYNSGNATFPFEKRPGVSINVGCADKDTIKAIDNTLVWSGLNETGGTSVYRADGYTPKKISSPYVDTEIQGGQSINGLRAEALTWEGQSFYILNSTTASSESMAYHLNSGSWFFWFSGLITSNGFDICGTAYAHSGLSTENLIAGNRQSGDLLYLANGTTEQSRDVKFGFSAAYVQDNLNPITINQLELNIKDTAAPSNGFTIRLEADSTSRTNDLRTVTNNIMITDTAATTAVSPYHRVSSLGQGIEFQIVFSANAYRLEVFDASILYDVDSS